MAAIEKICEFSGEYVGYEMYDFKRNHIQISPEYRKEFRGKTATLYVFKSDLYVEHKGYFQDANLGCVNPNPTESDFELGYPDRQVSIENGVRVFYSVFYQNLKEYKDSLKEKHARLVQGYEYILYVPEVKGEVNGFYMNQSFEMSKVIRKLKRLVGSKNLAVKYEDCEIQTFLDIIEF